jgi:hypothetical protein
MRRKHLSAFVSGRSRQFKSKVSDLASNTLLTDAGAANDDD